LRIYLAVLWLALVGSACSMAAQTPVASGNDVVLTNADILQMSSAGLSPEIIQAKIANSKCRFDTSPKALLELKNAGIQDPLILSMVSAPTQAELQPDPLVEKNAARAAAVAAEKARAAEKCPGCIGLMVSQFNESTKSITDNWLTKNQLAYMKERREKNVKEHLPHHFWTPQYAENADYVIVWSSARGSRAYTTYAPHTMTSTTSFSGGGSATTHSTYYEPQESEWQFLNVVATVYDRNGTKKYETFHQGNFRWSKPDEDCLVDAINYLTPK